jgi:hypothetical protein
MLTGWNPKRMMRPTPPPKGTVHTLPPVVSFPSAASPLARLCQFAVMIRELLMYQPFFNL